MKVKDTSVSVALSSEVMNEGERVRVSSNYMLISNEVGGAYKGLGITLMRERE